MKENDTQTAVRTLSRAVADIAEQRNEMLTGIGGANLLLACGEQLPQMLIREQETTRRLLEVIDSLLRVIETTTKTERQ